MKFLKKIIVSRETLLLIVLVAVGGFLRLYRLEELMTYLGDEGRDMLILMDILEGRNFPLIGPPTSVGELYLGPIYYYFIAPFAWLFRMNPIGPAVFVAILGALTIPLIYLVMKNFFNSSSALFSALLYTISPLIVKFSRSSWNPNPMPFFCLLLILALFYWQKLKKGKFLYLAVICFGIMLQLHYLVVLLAPFLVFVIYRLGKGRRNKKTYLYSLLIFFLLLSPLLLFDLKHGFVNTKGIFNIFKGRSEEGFSLFDLLSRGKDRIRQLFSLFLGFSERETKNNLLVISVAMLSLFGWRKQKKITKLVIYGWFVWGVLAIGLYRQSVYPHYLGFLFPFPAILIGESLNQLFSKGKLAKVLSLGLLFWLLIIMSRESWRYLSQPPTLNIKLVRSIAELVKKESKGKQFNFALLAKNNYDASYRYFFKLWHIPAVYQTEVAQQLFVVCEDEEVCQPEGNPKWEIALFDAAYGGKIKREGEWQPDPLIKVFKFVPK